MLRLKLASVSPRGCHTAASHMTHLPRGLTEKTTSDKYLELFEGGLKWPLRYKSRHPAQICLLTLRWSGLILPTSLPFFLSCSQSAPLAAVYSRNMKRAPHNLLVRSSPEWMEWDTGWDAGWGRRRSQDQSLTTDSDSLFHTNTQQSVWRVNKSRTCRPLKVQENVQKWWKIPLTS